ncbi:MAG: hypothetical protein GC200_09355 [Tepidisphaera sp.]|nr:hypothetical protein [Tepidisphaera sp.]
MAATTYPLSRSTGVCAASGRAFAEAEQYVATLVERAGQSGLERLDFSIEAWEGGARPAAPFAMFAFWRASFSPHPEKAKPLLGDAELVDLFEELAVAEQPKQVAFRYFVALLLVRRRLLRQVGVKPGVLLVSPKGSPETMLEVKDPGVDEGVIAEALEQLGRVVNVEGAGAA